MLPGERARHEVGGYIRVALKEQVTENHYAVRLDLFSNYLEEPTIDIFTDHVLTLKVNSWLSTTLGDLDLRQGWNSCCVNPTPTSLLTSAMWAQAVAETNSCGRFVA